MQQPEIISPGSLGNVRKVMRTIHGSGNGTLITSSMTHPRIPLEHHVRRSYLDGLGTWISHDTPKALAPRFNEL